jgi:hypothetical protein
VNYLNLNRRFVERENYDPDELVASEVRGKRVDWSKVQESRFSMVVAPANFGKTTEMQHRAKQIREESEAAVFVALRRMADRGSFEKALEGDERKAYLAWKAAPTGTLTLFIDSLDEAAAGKTDGIEYLVSDIADEVSWPNERIKWVISTRPAVLTSQVFDKLSELLVRPATTVRANVNTPSKIGGQAGSATSAATASAAPEKLRLFSMVQLDTKQAVTYLEGCYAGLLSDMLLRVARERGLAGFTRNPGGLDILARIDLLTSPPDSLTEVFTRVVGAIQSLRGADRRLVDAGSPPPEKLGQAARMLASASQVCQLVNIEMPVEMLSIPEKTLSARLIATPLLTERAINQLLNSQLFIDVGFHQVKMYPNELVPFMAAQRLAELVESPDQALRLVQNFTWSSPSGEQGVHQANLPLMGWLATMNPHCREVILRCDPQALAFFGDLRNSSVRQAEAEEALSESIRRLVEHGDHPGRNMFTLTSENFWQAGPDRLVPVITRLFDKYGDHDWARDVLMDIATACRLDALRAKVLRRHARQYKRLLEDSADVRYLLELGIEVDLAGLAAAVKASETASESLVALLIGRLGWTHFSPSELARLIDKQFASGQDGFRIGYTLESGGLLESATEAQLYQLCRGLVVRVARLRDRQRSGRRAHGRVDDRYVEMTVEVVTALLSRASTANIQRTARLCLVLQRVLTEEYSGTADTGDLRRALQENTSVRRSLLTMEVKRARQDEHKLWMAVFGFEAACEYDTEDVKAVDDPLLNKIYAEFMARVAAQPSQPAAKKSPPSRLERLKVGATAKKELRDMQPSLRDGTATNGLAWVAAWLLQTNPNSRYGEINFDVFEREAGKNIADAVREGFGQVWRKHAPQYDEAKPRTTYHITVAGLQGLHIELGQGEALAPLSEHEIRQALRYGTFEINGYPKWFWKLVKAHPDIAASELSKMAGEIEKGSVSREHAEELFASLDQAPAVIRKTLSSLAWSYLVKCEPTREYVTEQILHAVMEVPAEVPQAEFERIALGKMKAAFKSPIPESPDAVLTALRADATMWGGHWLTSYLGSFQKAVSKWGPKEPAAVRVFIAHLAAYFGRDRFEAIMKLAQGSNDGVMTLEHMYHWTMWAVRPEDDITRPTGVVYSPNALDNAQRFRDRLIGAIASANTQLAYEVLGRIHAQTSGPKEMYIRKVQFELRERQFARQPFPQAKYDQFEKDFRADATDSLSFAMAIHSDLQAVKYDIERGEHSLRSFFSKLDFKHVHKKGQEGEKAGLALEIDFQRLLASELNHHACERYSVSVESHTAESKRRDVLCSRNDWRASIELKMSVRWTLDDYVEALERQLVGQYMRHNMAMTGFLVLVLQTKDRQWKNPATGKMVGFDEVLTILREKAQALESNNRSMYLRVIGIDATTPSDFRKDRKGLIGARRTKRPSRASGVAVGTGAPRRRGANGAKSASTSTSPGRMRR